MYRYLVADWSTAVSTTHRILHNSTRAYCRSGFPLALWPPFVDDEVLGDEEDIDGGPALPHLPRLEDARLLVSRRQRMLSLVVKILMPCFNLKYHRHIPWSALGAKLFLQTSVIDSAATCWRPDRLSTVIPVFSLVEQHGVITMLDRWNDEPHADHASCKLGTDALTTRTLSLVAASMSTYGHRFRRSCHPFIHVHYGFALRCNRSKHARIALSSPTSYPPPSPLFVPTSYRRSSRRRFSLPGPLE